MGKPVHASENATELQQPSPMAFDAVEDVDVTASGESQAYIVPSQSDEPVSTENDPPARSASDETLRRQIEDELRASQAEELRLAREEAVETGYQEGYSRGQAQADEEYATQLEALEALIKAARSALDQNIDGLTDIAVEIAFEATTKILGQAMARKEGVVTVVRELIGRARSAEKLLVRVSPQDYELLDSARADLLVGFEKAEVNILADDRVVLGGCLLETPGGSLDGRLEIQLQHFTDTLLAAKARWPDPDLESRT